MTQTQRHWLRAALAALVLVGSYPMFVLGFTSYHVLRSDLPGGGNGPLDAYRHTLASAVVAYTAGPQAVEWVIARMERGERESARMDRQNNRIGASIGAAARSLGDIEPVVRQHVLQGAMYADDPAQVTWLKPRRWRDNRFW